MARVGLVTCRPLPEPDPDEALLVAGLRPHFDAVELVAWNDPADDPGRCDVCVLRSCWDYPTAPEAFLAWLERADAGTRLLNPLAVVRWNLHKRYLAELENGGVPIVPTAWVERGAGTTLAEIRGARGWDDVVVKPAISAGSLLTRRFPPGEEEAGEAFLRELVAARDALVQPYVAAVERDGERALVWIDGEFTHAIGKFARFAGGEERVSEQALRLEEDELRFAEGVLERLPFRSELLYARVDVFRGDDGRLRLSELELIEPSLFLLQSPDACARLVRGIVARVN